MNKLFFELIQIALGTRICLSHTPSADEWGDLYAMAKKQSLVGVAFAGVQRLQQQRQEPPEMLYLTWMGMAAKIQQRNQVVDEQCVALQKRLSADGLDSVILKGQGVASLYGEHLRGLRQSGDIDVWVKGGFDKVNEFVQRTAPTKDLAYHRFHYDMFPDTEVELHFRPTLMRNLFENRKLQKWCDSVLPSEFVMTDLGFNVPPARFNRIFILTHIYRHFLFEGVGLRQVMDYYFVLKARNNDDVNDNLNPLLKEFRLTRFASALMWVIKTVFIGHDNDDDNDNWMICEPDEKEGRFLLEEIMQMGNFGQQDKRYKGDGKAKRFVNHWSHLLLHYPSEVVWSPVWIVYHWFWKRIKLKAIS